VVNGFFGFLARKLAARCRHPTKRAAWPRDHAARYCSIFDWTAPSCGPSSPWPASRPLAGSVPARPHP